MTAIRMRITDDDLKDIKPDSPLYVRVVAELCEFDEESPYRKYAKDRLQVDGDLEFDDDAAVSLGADNGAYIMCWKWIDDDVLRAEGYLEHTNDN
jgi:hypothetical protein